MTNQEYIEQSDRVRKYNKLDSEIKRLNIEKSRIERGILAIDCFYRFSIDCCGRYDGFEDNLQKALIRFYDYEIDKLKKQLDEV